MDNPDASGFVAGVVVPVLGVTTPALFLGGLAGLYSWTGSEGSPLRRAALLVGLAGTALGLFDGLDWWEPDWWSLLFVALTAAGLEMGLLGGVAVPGCPAVRLWCPRVGFLAHRPRLLLRPGAHAAGSRRVCGLVLPELRSVGGGAISCDLAICITS